MRSSLKSFRLFQGTSMTTEAQEHTMRVSSESPALGTSPIDEHTAPAATVTFVAAPMADFSPRAGLERMIRILEQINRDNSQDEAQPVPEEDINKP